MPISRVRSVTETSMMFMMPMPPTSSDTAAMPVSRYVKTCVVSPSVLRKSAWLRIMEVVRLALREPVLAAEHALNVGHRVGDLVLGLRRAR